MFFNDRRNITSAQRARGSALHALLERGCQHVLTARKQAAVGLAKKVAPSPNAAPVAPSSRYPPSFTSPPRLATPPRLASPSRLATPPRLLTATSPEPETISATSSLVSVHQVRLEEPASNNPRENPVTILVQEQREFRGFSMTGNVSSYIGGRPTGVVSGEGTSVTRMINQQFGLGGRPVTDILSERFGLRGGPSTRLSVDDQCRDIGRKPMTILVKERQRFRGLSKNGVIMERSDNLPRTDVLGADAAPVMPAVTRREPDISASTLAAADADLERRSVFKQINKHIDILGDRPMTGHRSTPSRPTSVKVTSGSMRPVTRTISKRCDHGDRPVVEPKTVFKNSVVHPTTLPGEPDPPLPSGPKKQPRCGDEPCSSKTPKEQPSKKPTSAAVSINSSRVSQGPTLTNNKLTWRDRLVYRLIKKQKDQEKNKVSPKQKESLQQEPKEAKEAKEPEKEDVPYIPTLEEYWQIQEEKEEADRKKAEADKKKEEADRKKQEADRKKQEVIDKKLEAIKKKEAAIKESIRKKEEAKRKQEEKKRLKEEEEKHKKEEKLLEIIERKQQKKQAYKTYLVQIEKEEEMVSSSIHLHDVMQKDMNTKGDKHGASKMNQAIKKLEKHLRKLKKYQRTYNLKIREKECYIAAAKKQFGKSEPPTPPCIRNAGDLVVEDCDSDVEETALMQQEFGFNDPDDDGILRDINPLPTEHSPPADTQSLSDSDDEDMSPRRCVNPIPWLSGRSSENDDLTKPVNRPKAARGERRQRRPKGARARRPALTDYAGTDQYRTRS